MKDANFLAKIELGTVGTAVASILCGLAISACGGEVIDSVKNEAPTAIIEGPFAAAGGEVVEFSGSKSSDLDGSLVGFDWDFGDGATARGETVQHIFNTRGTFVVRLTVSDNLGAKGQANASIMISTNSPPVAVITGPTAGAEAATLAFDGSSSTDSDGSLVSYDWNFGDGQSATGATTTHAYPSAGSYELSLTVVDEVGASDTAYQTVTIDAAPADYTGRWEWHLTNEALRTDTCGTFQDSQLDITVNGTSLTVSELANGSVVQTYTGNLVGTSFSVTYTSLFSQTITGNFDSPTSFTGDYSIDTGGILNCAVKPVAGTKL